MRDVVKKQELLMALRPEPEAAPLGADEAALCDFWDGLQEQLH